MTMLRLIILVLFLGLPAGALASVVWVEDYEQGRAQAEARGLPTFVYFDARWCSWCHRYLEETLSEPQVANYLNRHYVSIKLDWDERPDRVRHYGARGLPFTVLLTPDGALRNRFVGIVGSDDLLAQLQQGRVGVGDIELRSGLLPSISPTGLDRDAWQQFERHWLDTLQALYLAESGGLHGLFDTGLTLKWPQPLSWLWLEQNGHWPERHAAAQQSDIERLLDVTDGGFFNYRELRIDFLESSKLLESNAWQLAWLQADHPEVALSVQHWLRHTLRSTDGAFYQAQIAAADYYALPAATREQQRAPAVDNIIRADSNGMAIWALSCAVQRGADETLLELAEAALRDVLDRLYHEGRLRHSLRHSPHGEQLAPRAWAEDWFALLAGAAALYALQPQQDWPVRLTSVAAEAQAWLERQRSEAIPLDSDRAALIAWVAVQPIYRPWFSTEDAHWAIGQLRLEAETLPDSIVPGLAAWQRLLGLEMEGCL